MLVHFVVGQFNLLEGHYLLPELFPSVRRVGMSVDPARSGWISFSCNQPGRSVVGVSVSFIVYGNDVQEHRIPLIGADSCKGHPHGWEHPPEKKEGKI